MAGQRTTNPYPSQSAAMIVRIAGSRVESVEPRFDARALTEIAFRPSGELRQDAESFFEEHEEVSTHELTATAEGDVKDEVERELLDILLDRLRSLEAEHEDAVLCVTNKPGKDYPKTRDETRTIVVRGENRLAFEYRVDPPLRVAVYRKRTR